MKKSFVRKVRKSGAVLVVTIPKEIIDELKIKEGDYIKVTVERVA